MWLNLSDVPGTLSKLFQAPSLGLCPCPPPGITLILAVGSLPLSMVAQSTGGSAILALE